MFSPEFDLENDLLPYPLEWVAPLKDSELPSEKESSSIVCWLEKSLPWSSGMNPESPRSLPLADSLPNSGWDWK